MVFGYGMISGPEFLQAGIPAVLRASALARSLEGTATNVPKLKEISPVKAAMTLADSETQEVILLSLRERFSSAQLLAEEDTSSVSSFSEQGEETIVLDPIDGTFHGYLGGEGPYSTNLGLVKEGRYSVSIVSLPREHLIFYVSSEGAPKIQEATGAPRLARVTSKGRGIFVSQYVPDSVRTALSEKGYEPTFGSGGAISVAPLVPGVVAGLRVSPSAEGVSIRGRVGLPITLAAGAIAATKSGDFPLEISQKSDHLITATDEATLKDIRDALTQP